MKKSFRTHIPLLILMSLMLLFTAVNVSASPKLTKLSLNKTYKSFDLTGDGRNDTIKCTKRDSYSGLYVTLNGKRHSFDYYQFAVYVYKYNAKNTFLVINHHAGGYGTGVEVYRYSGGTFKSATGSDGIGSTNSCYIYKASGNQLWVKAGIRKPHQSLSFKQVYNNLPTWIERYKVNTSKHTVVLASRYASFTGTKFFKYCGYSALQTNSGPTKTDRKGVRITYGTKVQFLQAYIKVSYSTYNGQKYAEYRRAYKVKVNGKTGWFDESASYPFTDA